jgi:hypothetical protein
MGTERHDLRRLIAGALCDFVGYLDELQDPIIVGQRYSKKLLIAAFSDWLAIRNFNVKGASGQVWIEACKKGAFKAPMEDTNDSAE